MPDILPLPEQIGGENFARRSSRGSICATQKFGEWTLSILGTAHRKAGQRRKQRCGLPLRGESKEDTSSLANLWFLSFRQERNRGCGLRRPAKGLEECSENETCFILMPAPSKVRFCRKSECGPLQELPCKNSADDLQGKKCRRLPLFALDVRQHRGHIKTWENEQSSFSWGHNTKLCFLHSKCGPSAS